MANAVTRHIPNTITCCNLLSGCLAILAATQNNTKSAFLWIIAGACFDFCDGLAARLLKAYSPIGKELDSLADLITFGLAPSLLCMGMLDRLSLPCVQMRYIALMLAAAAALRLAKFNTDERQTTSFLGLAVPANAIFWCGAAIWTEKAGDAAFLPWLIIALIVVFSILMISEIPMFSLKFKNLSWKDNAIRFIFLAGAVICGCVLGLKGASAIIIWYILLSVLTGKRA